MEMTELENIMMKAFVAGYNFRILKKGGGKGIDFYKWKKIHKEQIKNLIKKLN